MYNAKFIFSTVLLTVLLSASAAAAATTTAGVSIARGQSDSMAYSLHIKQQYEPWVSNELFDFSPVAELGGHAWVDDDDDVDTVWGGFLAPGVRFALNTDKALQPYLEATVGGALNSDDELDERKLGSHALFRTRGSVGVAFGEEARHRVQGDYVHYSTWGLTKNNAGYSTYGLSYGYSF